MNPNFRDSNAKEIDVFAQENNVIHPLEIKKSAAKKQFLRRLFFSSTKVIARHFLAAY